MRGYIRSSNGIGRRECRGARRWWILTAGVLLFLEILIGLLTIETIMFAFMADHLTAWVQNISAALAHTMDVIADGGEFATIERASLGL